jgi:hypothetical protein
MTIMNKINKLLSPGASIINRGIYNYRIDGSCGWIRDPIKKSLGFHLIPYDQQYETRDSDYLVGKVSDKILLNRKNYIKEFNPYLKCNVSDQSLKEFYMKR